MCVCNQALQAPPPTRTVRLVNGSSSYEGRLEVYYNSTWGTVCDDSFEDVDARVACNSLGYGYVLNIHIKQQKSLLKEHNSTA